MLIRSVVIAGYLLALLGIGLAAQRRRRRTPDDYFLASRTLSTPILFLTMAATNFSAFTVFGVSGAGWESGYAVYPIMAFGTGFMAISFVLIGRPAWSLGRAHGLTTPAELVFHLTGSPVLRLLFFAVMAAFTLPYLAMQPMAAGYALESLLGIPYFAGAVLITGVMLAYTFLGGLRGVSWTDAFQGGTILLLLGAAVVVIAGRLGGLPAAHRAVAIAHPELFARPGLNALYPPGVWMGYMLLWLLCDPMFPQLFQRFYAARSPRGLSRTMTLYPLLTGLLFLLPSTIGVIGRAAIPTLPPGATSDQILPILLRTHAPPVIEALVLTAALAALMSTLDSQLLTLSSMFTHDLVAPIRRRFRSGPSAADADVPPWVGKAFVVLLALGGLAIARRPPATFLQIATETFTGLAVLFPTVVAILYWRRTDPASAIASILVGEAMVVGYHFGVLPTLGTLPVVPVVLVTTGVLLAGSWIRGGATASTRSAPSLGGAIRRPSRIAWTLLFAGLFLAGHDLWNWGDTRRSLLGYPGWVWWFVGLCAATSAAFWAFSRALARGALRSPTRRDAAGVRAPSVKP